jgi:hypothetical protein
MLSSEQSARAKARLRKAKKRRRKARKTVTRVKTLTKVTSTTKVGETTTRVTEVTSSEKVRIVYDAADDVRRMEESPAWGMYVRRGLPY